MMDLTNPALLAIATTIAGEALKTWGSYALVLIAFGLMHWRADRRLKALEIENETLRKEVTLLQEKRLEDARQLIRVTETGTATMSARSEADQQFRDVMKLVVENLADIKDFVRPPPAPRPTPRRPSR